MEIAENTPTRELTIAGKAFTVPAPFAEGQEVTLSAGIASQLNQVLAENVRNNLASKYEEKLDDLTQAVVDAYVADYEFGARSGGGGRVADPVEREAITIASGMVKDAIRANEKLKLSDYKQSDITTLAKKLLAGPKGDAIRSTAAENVARQRAVASATLEELGIG
jgi:hypothetical protein